MSGSLACIAGGILIVYANMGARADYLMAAKPYGWQPLVHW
jgi:CNT family concentrative nucleoside transporter